MEVRRGFLLQEKKNDVKLVKLIGYFVIYMPEY